MAVAFDASSESHTGTTGSASQASFSWTHTPVGTPEAVIVYTFTNANADNATSVTYGGYQMRAVSGGRAVNTAGEAGDCKTWMLTRSNQVPPTGTWSSASSPGFGTNTIYALAYGNGYWIGGADATDIRYATDPRGTWTAVTGIGAFNTYGAAYGNGYWVVAGDNGAAPMRIYATTDPTGTWTEASRTWSSVTASAFGAAYGNGYFLVLASTVTKLHYATDPTGTWTSVSNTDSGFTGNVNDAAYGNGYWVAVGDSGQLRYRATDPAGVWTAASSPGFGTDSIVAVAYGNGYWVASGSGTLRYAADPTGTWSAVAGGALSARRIAYADGYWVAVGNSGVVRYATDPTGTWKDVTLAGFDTSIIYEVAYGAGNWVSGGVSGKLRVADEGVLSVLPTGAQTVVVNRTNNANVMYAVANTFTAARPIEVSGISLTQGDSTLSEQSITDGSLGTESVRMAAVNSGLTNVDLTTTTTAASTLVLGANSTNVQSIRLAGANDFTSERQYAVSTTALSTSASGTSIGSGDTSSSTFAAAQTMKRSSLAVDFFAADSRDWSITYVLTGILAQYEARMKLQRLNSSGTMQTESGYGTTRSANGTYTDTLTWAPGTWATNDQLALVWEHRRTSATETNYLTSTTALSTTSSGTSIASGSTQSATFVVAQTMVRSSIPAGYFASGSQTWTLNYTVTSMTTPDYEMRLKLQRRNSSGTMQAETAYGTTRTTNAAFTDTFTADLGTWAANDQLAVVWEHRRVSGTGNKSASITAGGTSYVTAPVPARNSSMTANGSSYVDSPTVAGFRVIGVVRETTAGQGSRSVGFQSTTSDDTAAVYLVVREAIVPWTVGAPIR